MARVGVVVGQAVDHLLERNDARRRDDADLSHAAADHAPVDARAVDELCVAAHDREPIGAARPFDRQNVTLSASFAQLGRCRLQRDSGVEDARAVDVQGSAGLVGERGDLAGVARRQGGAVAVVVRVFDADERRAREVALARPYQVPHLVEVHRPCSSL